MRGRMEIGNHTPAELRAFFEAGARRIKQGAAGLADTVPVYAQMSNHAARLAGVSTRTFFRDAATFLRCELDADLFYGLDAPTINYDVYNIESEALGAPLVWTEGEIPAIDPSQYLLKSVSDFRQLRPPPAGTAGRMPFVLEINRRLADLGLAPKVRFTGLFTLAANLVGLQELILAAMTEPEEVHEFLRFLTQEVVAPWIVCQREKSGVKVTATGSDALASPPLATVPMIHEFCLRYVQELEKSVGGIRLAGLWGESRVADPQELLAVKLAGSPGSIQALDPDVTALGPKYFRNFADQAGIDLIMGLDANLIGTGPVSAIVTRAQRFIEEGGQHGRFMLFMNDIPAATPSAHVQAVVATAREYHPDASRTQYVRAG